MRKFIFSGSILSAIFSGFGALSTTRKGPRDWRTILLWVSWGATLAIAIGTVIENANAADELQD